MSAIFITDEEFVSNFEVSTKYRVSNGFKYCRRGSIMKKKKPSCGTKSLSTVERSFYDMLCSR